MKDHEARELIRSEFPHIPPNDLTRLVPKIVQANAFSFGVFTARAIRSVAAAYVRHERTSYDSMLRTVSGHYYDGNRSYARQATQSKVSDILIKWQ